MNVLVEWDTLASLFRSAPRTRRTADGLDVEVLRDPLVVVAQAALARVRQREAVVDAVGFPDEDARSFELPDGAVEPLGPDAVVVLPLDGALHRLLRWVPFPRDDDADVPP